MLLEHKKVAIIGGGPGGLTLARLLQNRGVEVGVYERDQSRNLRTQGATLDLHFSAGLLALREAGLLDKFKEKYRPGADLGRVLSKDGEILFDEHEGAENIPESDFESPDARPEIDRSVLRDLLLDSLAPGTVAWDHRFVKMEKEGARWKIYFENGTTATADIVAGADGANSKIRPYLTPIRAEYTGTILQGNVEDAENRAPTMWNLLKGGKIYVMHGGKYLHISAKGDGSIDCYTSTRKPENWAKEIAKSFGNRRETDDFFRGEFAGWSEIFFGLFGKLELPLLVRPQYAVPAGQYWDAQDGATILGDAAHIMAPSGAGVNLAMLDALELCQSLCSTEFTDTRAAIAHYEDLMRARAAAEAETSREMAEWTHADGAQEKMLAFFGLGE